MNLDRIEKMEQEIKDLMNSVSHERSSKHRRDRELKMEIKAIEIQMEKLELENSALRDQLKISKETTSKSDIQSIVEEDDEVNEIKQVLQSLHPNYWEFLEKLIHRRPLTLELLKALIEKKEIKLVILAMSLMTDHTICLEIVKELEEERIVSVEYKREGDLNPMIRLQYSG